MGDRVKTTPRHKAHAGRVVLLVPNPVFCYFDEGVGCLMAIVSMGSSSQWHRAFGLYGCAGEAVKVSEFVSW